MNSINSPENRISIFVARMNSHSGAPNTGILGNHLVKRQHLVVAIAAVPFGRDGQHAEAARTGFRPTQGCGERRLFGRLFQSTSTEFHRKIAAPRLPRQRVHEDLDAAEQIGSMIVISGGGGNGEIGPLGRHGLAKRHCSGIGGSRAAGEWRLLELTLAIRPKWICYIATCTPILVAVESTSNNLPLRQQSEQPAKTQRRNSSSEHFKLTQTVPSKD